MRIEYRDATLRALAQDPVFSSAQWHPDLVRNCRKKIQMVAAAMDERDLREVRSLRFKQLHGQRAGTYSIRLNDQFRLIVALQGEGDDRAVVLLEMVDYH